MKTEIIKTNKDNDFNIKEFISCVKKNLMYDKIFFCAWECTAIQYANTHAAKRRITGHKRLQKQNAVLVFLNTAT